LAYEIAREKLKDLKIRCDGSEKSEDLVDDAVLTARKAAFEGVRGPKASGAAVTAARKAAFEDRKVQYDKKERTKEPLDAAVDAARKAAVEGVKGQGKLEVLA
jgi:hypothetical protein